MNKGGVAPKINRAVSAAGGAANGVRRPCWIDMCETCCDRMSVAKRKERRTFLLNESMIDSQCGVW